MNNSAMLVKPVDSFFAMSARAPGCGRARTAGQRQVGLRRPTTGASHLRRGQQPLPDLDALAETHQRIPALLGLAQQHVLLCAGLRRQLNALQA